jgi:hypothetical protein
MLFDFILKQTKPNLDENILTVRGRQIPLATIRNNRARRYLLKLCPDGSARLTIPRRGSVIEGHRFAEKNTDWLAEQLEKLAAHPVEPNVTVKIYFGKNRVSGTTYQQFTLAYYDGAKRVKKRFADLAEAKREGELAATSSPTVRPGASPHFTRPRKLSPSGRNFGTLTRFDWATFVPFQFC